VVLLAQAHDESVQEVGHELVGEVDALQLELA
jgi:hypothetical protein